MKNWNNPENESMLHYISGCIKIYTCSLFSLFDNRLLTGYLRKTPLKEAFDPMKPFYGPKDFWEVKQKGNLKFNDALKPKDKRYVNLNEARGQDVYNRLLRPLGFDNNFNPRMIDNKENYYILFCGHRGCGKSTELNCISEKLHRSDGYFVVRCNIVEDLDINNIEYVDILFLVAQKIVENLENTGISIDRKYIEDMNNFFTERIITHVKEKGFNASFTAGAKAEIGFLAKLFAEFTTAFKTNSTYRDEVRKLVKNQFSIFKTAFNRMLAEINLKLEENNKGKSLLVTVDGTDKLSREDCDHIFIDHAAQLTQLETNFIYVVPIHMVYESNHIKNFYENPFVLPNVILNDKEGKPVPLGMDAMKDLVYRRIHPDLFDSEKTVEYIINMSGGHIRELIHILQEAFNASDTEKFDIESVKKGIKQLEADYMRFLKTDDYKRLAKLEKDEDNESDDIMKNLLFNSVVLEYDDYWRRINPIIKESDEFKRFLKANEA